MAKSKIDRVKPFQIRAKDRYFDGYRKLISEPAISQISEIVRSTIESRKAFESEVTFKSLFALSASFYLKFLFQENESPREYEKRSSLKISAPRRVSQAANAAIEYLMILPGHLKHMAKLGLNVSPQLLADIQRLQSEVLEWENMLLEQKSELFSLSFESELSLIAYTKLVTAVGEAEASLVVNQCRQKLIKAHYIPKDFSKAWRESIRTRVRRKQKGKSQKLSKVQKKASHNQKDEDTLPTGPLQGLMHSRK